ncbi:MAG: hypothetical protein KAU62_12235 [Candidatus Heimdallarchaeota archaeon]|nr:hypothetical protein [Candidatus Heimdallarchaeota archaeon]MCK4611917.1 hypothetical protein [Candidatus Heimdallarchaeota archaeon]
MRLNIKNRPLKITHSFEYTFNNKQVKISLSKNTILLPVFDENKNRQIGFLLEGPIGIIADLLVHSQEGAVGEIVEETYSNVLLFPVKLPFLSPDHVKEIQPLEDISSQEEIIKRYRVQLVHDEYISYEEREGIMIQTYNPSSLWFISQESTFLIDTEEKIGRRGEKKLFWLVKDSFTTVSNRGLVKTTKDLFSVSKVQKTVHRILDTPLASIFSRFSEIFASI